MKGILKKLLCTAAAAVLISSAVCAFADGETMVEIDDYMYDAKEVYVDDDFNDRQIGGGVADSGYDKSIDSASNFVVSDDTGSVNLKSTVLWSSSLNFVKVNNIDSDSLAISFKFKVTDSGDNTFRLSFGSAPVMVFFRNSSTIKAGVYTSSSASSYIWQANCSTSGWEEVYVVFKRNSSDKVEMKHLSINKVSQDMSKLSNKELSYSGSKNWWSGDLTSQAIRIYNFSKIGIYIDDVLIYEPYDFEISSYECADGDTDIKMHFTAGVDLDNLNARIIGENGAAQECDVTTENSSSKSLVLNFGEAVDLSNQSYCISIGGIKSLTGEALDDMKIILSKRVADISVERPVISTNAETGMDEVTGVFNLSNVEASEVGNTVYAVMSVWDEAGTTCIDFKVQEVVLAAEDSAVEVRVPVDDAEKAKKVQMFFLDSVENMKIVSEVFEADI